MNLLLIRPGEISGGRAEISGARVRHLERIGEECRAGILGGGIGHAKVLKRSADGKSALLELDTMRETPPPGLPVVLVMALPRPKTLRKVIACAVSMGVKEIHFFQTFKVEKSYWSSPFLAAEFLENEAEEALMQAVDTMPVRFGFHRLFKPFVEDELPELCRKRKVVIAHPSGGMPFRELSAPPPGIESVLILGPEGGFTEYECGKILACAQVPDAVTLGHRILRTEFALAVLLGLLAER